MRLRENRIALNDESVTTIQRAVIGVQNIVRVQDDRSVKSAISPLAKSYGTRGGRKKILLFARLQDSLKWACSLRNSGYRKKEHWLIQY